MAYVQHMYDTRHQIFQFAVALNSALLAAIFQFIQEDSGRLALSLVGLFVTSAITLMARRSLAYLVVLEAYAAELETETWVRAGAYDERADAERDRQHPVPPLHLWILVVVWAILTVFFISRVAST